MKTSLKNNSLLHKTIEYREQTRAVLQNQLNAKMTKMHSFGWNRLLYWNNFLQNHVEPGWEMLEQGESMILFEVFK